MSTQAKRVKRDWEHWAKEPLDVRRIGGAWYGFGNELACRRVHYVYRLSGDDARILYSTNMQTWAVVLETPGVQDDGLRPCGHKKRSHDETRDESEWCDICERIEREEDQ